MPTKERRTLSPSEARGLLACVRGDRLEALYTVALALGLRQGEALGLQWDDVDLDGGHLTVRHALQRLRLVEPKSRQSHRTIALPQTVITALRAHRTLQMQERLVAGMRWHDSGFVFTTTCGTPLDGVAVTRRFQAHLARIGLPRLRFHDLRHSCATLLLAEGVSPRVVMETLGHSDIRLTLNVYTHVLPTLQLEAAERMDRMLTAG